MFLVELPKTITCKYETGQVICAKACDQGTLLREIWVRTTDKESEAVLNAGTMVSGVKGNADCTQATASTEK